MSDPYPITMNRCAVTEIVAADPDVVVAKGDLTAVGSHEEYQAFLDTYAPLADRLHHVRGNHDAMQHAHDGARRRAVRGHRQRRHARRDRHRSGGSGRWAAHPGPGGLARGDRGGDDRTGPRLRPSPDLGSPRTDPLGGLLRDRPRQQRGVRRGGPGSREHRRILRRPHAPQSGAVGSPRRATSRSSRSAR